MLNQYEHYLSPPLSLCYQTIEVSCRKTLDAASSTEDAGYQWRALHYTSFRPLHKIIFLLFEFIYILGGSSFIFRNNFVASY